MKEEPIHTEIYKGYKIDIFPDRDPQNPRDDDNVGTMICFHNKYQLGDYNHGFKTPRDFMESLYTGNKDVGEIENDDLQKIIGCDNIFLPLYLYDHSGITMSTGRFSCPWDSGQVGWIYCSKKRAKEEWLNSHGIAGYEEQARKYMTQEVQTYDNYLTGNVYGYVVSKNVSLPGSSEEELEAEWEEVDACWGFNADYLSEDWKYLLDEARGQADYEERKSLPLLDKAGILKGHNHGV